MPLPSSGAISLLEIRDYYNKTGKVSLKELYRGGGVIPDIPENNNIPTSGPIKLSDFYNAYKLVPQTNAFVTIETLYTTVRKYTHWSTTITQWSTTKRTYTFISHTVVWFDKPGITRVSTVTQSSIGWKTIVAGYHTTNTYTVIYQKV